MPPNKRGDFLGIGNRGRRTLGKKVGGSEYVEAAAISATPGSLKRIQPAPFRAPSMLQSACIATSTPPVQVMHICMPMYQITCTQSMHMHAPSPPAYPRGYPHRTTLYACQAPTKSKGGMCSVRRDVFQYGVVSESLVSLLPCGCSCMYPCTSSELQTDIQGSIYR